MRTEPHKGLFRGDTKSIACRAVGSQQLSTMEQKQGQSLLNAKATCQGDALTWLARDRACDREVLVVKLIYGRSFCKTF